MQTAHCKIVFVLFSYALRWCEGWKGDGSSPTKTGFSIIVISSQKVISCLPHCKATTEAAIVQSCTALYERTEAGCLIYTSNIRPTTISSASTVLSIAMYTKTIYYCSNTIIILHTLRLMYWQSWSAYILLLVLASCLGAPFRRSNNHCHQDHWSLRWFGSMIRSHSSWCCDWFEIRQ